MTNFTFLEDYVINVYLLLGQGHTVTIYTKFSQMSHICIRLVVHDIFYLPILLGCMIPKKKLCVLYCATFMQRIKKSAIQLKTYKTQVGARNYLSCGHHISVVKVWLNFILLYFI